MTIIRGELRDDYRRMAGIELSDAEVTEMAWEEACREASGGREDDWDDEHRWELGPARGGHDDGPEATDRASHERGLKTVVLPVHGGGYRQYRADLTHAQMVALRGLTLESWIACMATHSDRVLKVGHGPFSIVVCDTDDRAHVMRIETDGQIIHTGPRA